MSSSRILSHPFVFAPKDTLYHLPGTQWGSHSVSLLGGKLHLSWINFETLTYEIKERINGEQISVQWSNELGDRLVSKHAISYLRGNQNLPSILLYFYDIPETLYTTPHLTFAWTRGVVVPSGVIPVLDLDVCNVRLQRECQELVEDVVVEAGVHPIYSYDSQPTKTQMDEIFKKFFKYNKKRLPTQWKNTIGLCHVRAHFLVILLSQYYICAQKVYKFWHENDWFSFNNHEPWEWHCAVMINDKDNQKWVWDPWVDFAPEILAFNQWAKKSDEPLPAKILITNHVVIKDPTGSLDDHGIMWETFDSNCTGTIQYLWRDSIPDSPERALVSNQEQIASYLHSNMPFLKKITTLISAYLL